MQTEDTALLTIGGNTFHRDPDYGAATAATTMVLMMQDAITAATERANVIKQNPRLSPAGKTFDVEKVEDELVRSAVTTAREFDRMEASIAAAQEKFATVPALEPTDAVGYMADKDRREYVLKQSAVKQTALLQAWERGERLELAIALIRSDLVTSVDDGKDRQLVDAARKAWAQKCRTTDPLRAANLDAHQRSLEWGRRIFSHQQGAVNTMTGIQRDPMRMKRILEQSKD